MLYDVTTLSVRPATPARALPRLEEALPKASGKLLACWYTDIGTLNKIMIIREYESDRQAAEAREATAKSDNPFGAAEFIVSATSDTYVLLPFLTAPQPGSHGPFFEVRDYLLKPGVLAGTIERWQKALPKRLERSSLLACMYSISGEGPRWVHIWPYKSLDERHSVRSGAVKDGIWPPPGGGDTLATQQTDIFIPAAFSPIK